MTTTFPLCAIRRARWLGAGCALLLLSARCDCGGALVEADAGAGVHVDARAEAALVDRGEVDGVATDAGAGDRDPGEASGSDRATADGTASDSALGDADGAETGARDRDPGEAVGADAGSAADGGAVDRGSAPVDASAPADAASRDHGVADADLWDRASADGVTTDARADGGVADVGGSADASPQVDGASSADAGQPAGLDTPCQNGPGWTLFRFHYDDSYSARLDVWDATCDYSLAPGSACNVVPVRTETLVHDGYALLVSGTAYIRVRFDVGGLLFSRASVHVQARSYATSSSTGIEVWSPLYGSVFGGPVDNDWTFDWYSMDWTGHLYPDDDPDLTAIQIYAHQGSNSLAVHAVELCVE